MTPATLFTWRTSPPRLSRAKAAKLIIHPMTGRPTTGRTIQRWERGESKVPPWLTADLLLTLDKTGEGK